MPTEGHAQTLHVDADDCPCRLDVFLAEAVEELSRTRIQKIIREGLATVDGAPAKPRHPLQGGETVAIHIPEPLSPIPEPEAIPLDILYEDDAVLVVNKPAGMVVHPGSGVRSGTLVNALLAHCDDLSGVGGAARPGIVHRLDRLTTGALAVAKTDAAHRALSAQLADRTMTRRYLAWVVGELPQTEGTVDAPIDRHPRHRTRMAVVRGGRRARTHWRIVARAPGLTRIECRLETGRTHQIRVHLQHLGYPVCGDPEYGIPAKRANQHVPPGYPKIIQALARLERQLLHAWRLEFAHPASGERLSFEAPPPPDFQAFDNALAPWTTPLE